MLSTRELAWNAVPCLTKARIRAGKDPCIRAILRTSLEVILAVNLSMQGAWFIRFFGSDRHNRKTNGGAPEAQDSFFMGGPGRLGVAGLAGFCLADMGNLGYREV